jgi:hypothetical protein
MTLLARRGCAAPSSCDVHLSYGFTQADAQSLAARGYHLLSVNKTNIQIADQLKNIPDFGRQNEFMIYRSAYPEGLGVAYKVLPDRWEMLEVINQTDLLKANKLPNCNEARQLTWYAYQWVHFGEPARNRLDNFYSTQLPVVGLGDSILTYEHFLTHVSETSPAADKDRKDYLEIVRAVHEAFYNSNAYDIKDKINVVREIVQPYVRVYHVGRNQMLDELHKVGGNCQSRAMFYSAIINDAALDWGDDYAPAIEVFDDHVEPVLFSAQHKEVYELISGQVLEKPRADILHPEVITWAYLNSLGRASEEERTFKLVLEHGPLLPSFVSAMPKFFPKVAPIEKQPVNNREWGKSSSHEGAPAPKEAVSAMSDFHRVENQKNDFGRGLGDFLGGVLSKLNPKTQGGSGKGTRSSTEEIQIVPDYSKVQKILGFDEFVKDNDDGQLKVIIFVESADKKKDFLTAPGESYDKKADYLAHQKIKKIKGSSGYRSLLRIQEDPSDLLSLNEEDYHQAIQSLHIVKDMHSSLNYGRQFSELNKSLDEPGRMNRQIQLLNQLMVAKPEELVRFSRFFAELSLVGSSQPLKALLELVLLKNDFTVETPNIQLENLHNFLTVASLQKSRSGFAKEEHKKVPSKKESDQDDPLFFGKRIRPEVYAAILLAQPPVLLHHPLVQMRNMFLWRAQVHKAYLRYFAPDETFETAFLNLWALSPMIYSTSNLASLVSSNKQALGADEAPLIQKTLSSLQHLAVNSKANFWRTYSSSIYSNLWWSHLPISAFDIPQVVEGEIEKVLQKRNVVWKDQLEPALYSSLQNKKASASDEEGAVGLVDAPQVRTDVTNASFGGLWCKENIAAQTLKEWFNVQSCTSTLPSPPNLWVSAVWSVQAAFVKVFEKQGGP